MRIIPPLTLLLVASVFAFGFEQPRFELDKSAADGCLTWAGHTVVIGFHEPVAKDDHIVIDSKAGMSSIGLHWASKADPKTGACMAASTYWRIPLSVLTAPCYVISVERSSQDELVFVLHEKSGAKAVLKSQPCRLGKAFCGRLEDIGKHITPVTIEMLDGAKQGKPTQQPAQQ